MNVTEVRCTHCLAPIDPANGPVQRCVYCGTTLTIGGAPSAAAHTLRLDDCGPNKIQVIKVIRTYTGLGLKEAKDLTESTPCVLMESADMHRLERFRDELVSEKARASLDGKSAAFRSAPARAPLRAGGAFLEDVGPSKIMVIKVVYDTLHLGLKDSKDLVERAPCVIGEHLDADASEQLREALRAAGARVR
ncbi:MAG TPA: ribosomal protein L7/L12 [Polyangiaceae bacterium]